MDTHVIKDFPTCIAARAGIFLGGRACRVGEWSRAVALESHSGLIPSTAKGMFSSHAARLRFRRRLALALAVQVQVRLCTVFFSSDRFCGAWSFRTEQASSPNRTSSSTRASGARCPRARGQRLPARRRSVARAEVMAKLGPGVLATLGALREDATDPMATGLLHRIDVAVCRWYSSRVPHGASVALFDGAAHQRGGDKSASDHAQQIRLVPLTSSR